jgi:hypothetical protein
MTLKLLTNDGQIVRFEVAGKITRDGWTNQKDPLANLFGDGVYEHKCLLSLRNALYIDSTGVEWLLTAHQRFAQAGGMLILHSPTASSKQLLKVMRMELVLNIVNDEHQAIELATKAGDIHAKPH